MKPHLSRSVVVAASLIAISLATPARADAIDGDWCFGPQNLNIQGSAIRTPGGTQMSGDYQRYSFRYVVPSNEPGAGTEVAMQFIRGEQMKVVRKSGSTSSEPETWQRCKPVS